MYCYPNFGTFGQIQACFTKSQILAIRLDKDLILCARTLDINKTLVNLSKSCGFPLSAG